MTQASYEFKVDTLRDGNYAASIDDLTSRLIGNASWNGGMSTADQDFAPPANLTVMLDNIDGAFNPDTLGSELLVNPDFTSWSLGQPASWTATVGVEEVAPDQLSGGAGTGACNFSTSGSVLYAEQTILTAGTTYKVSLNVSASANDTGWIAVYDDTTRVSPYYHNIGVYTFYFNATTTTFKIATSGSVNMTVNSVSVKAVSVYGQLLSEGTLGRLRATFSAVTYVLFIGRLTSFKVIPGSIGRRVAVLTFSDLTLDLLDTEYMPPFYTNTTADVPMAAIFDEPIVPYPYSSNYWLLGVQGSSELELTTTLYDPPSYSFDTGKQTFSYVGDNSIDNKDGVSAQSFIRDLVAGEIYGRFFFDPSLPGYKFHNRHRDALNTTVSFTITDSDYEVDSSAFARANVLNQSTVSFQPRATGDAATVIWSADDVPLGFFTETKILTARYRDLSNPAARVGATDVLPMLPGTDFIAVDDNQVDVTNYVMCVARPGANSAEISVTNPNSYTVAFTRIQLRGTPITTFDPRTVTSRNADSEFMYKRASEQISYALIDTNNDAQNIADYHVYKNSTPSSSFQVIGWNANKSSGRMTNALSAAVGQRITITDTWMNHNADYYIVGYRHSVTWGGEHTHETSLVIKPRDRENFWILETSLLGTDTRLGL